MEKAVRTYKFVEKQIVQTVAVEVPVITLKLTDAEAHALRYLTHRTITVPDALRVDAHHVAECDGHAGSEWAPIISRVLDRLGGALDGVVGDRCRFDVAKEIE